MALEPGEPYANSPPSHPPLRKRKWYDKLRFVEGRGRSWAKRWLWVLESWGKKERGREMLQGKEVWKAVTACLSRWKLAMSQGKWAGPQDWKRWGNRFSPRDFRRNAAPPYLDFIPGSLILNFWSVELKKLDTQLDKLKHLQGPKALNSWRLDCWRLWVYGDHHGWDVTSRLGSMLVRVQALRSAAGIWLLTFSHSLTVWPWAIHQINLRLSFLSFSVFLREIHLWGSSRTFNAAGGSGGSDGVCMVVKGISGKRIGGRKALGGPLVSQETGSWWVWSSKCAQRGVTAVGQNEGFRADGWSLMTAAQGDGLVPRAWCLCQESRTKVSPAMYIW